MNVQGGFQLLDVKGIVRRRGKMGAIVATVVALGAYWLAMALPNEYQSYATVLVEPQSISPDLVRAGLRDSDLNERLHLMSAQILSRPRLSRIIDQMDLYVDESETMLREDVIDLMRSRIRVEPVLPELEASASSRNRGDAEINQFRLFFIDENPRTAMEIAQQLANDFIERHIEERVNLSQKSLEFIEGELDRLAAQIQEVEAQIASVKAANPGRLPENLNTNQGSQQRLANALASAQRVLALARSDEAFYRSQAAAANTAIRSQDDANPARKIELLELALSEHKARGFTDKHPDVIKTKIEVEEIRVRMAEQAQTEEGDIAAAPPTFAQQSADAEAQRAALRVTATEEELDRLESRAEEVALLLAETPAVAEQLDALLREYQHLSRSYQDFSNRRLEATVQAQLERRQLGEQFRVLESAFMASAPASPNRPLIVVLGVMFGAALAAGLAVLAEGLDASVHTARQIQATLSLPVLASIPRIWLEADRAALRRQRLRTAFATTLAVVFALLGGAVNYAWVNGMPSFLAVEEAPAGGAPEGGAPEPEQGG